MTIPREQVVAYFDQLCDLIDVSAKANAAAADELRKDMRDLRGDVREVRADVSGAREEVTEIRHRFDEHEKTCHGNDKPRPPGDTTTPRRRENSSVSLRASAHGPRIGVHGPLAWAVTLVLAAVAIGSVGWFLHATTHPAQAAQEIGK